MIFFCCLVNTSAKISYSQSGHAGDFVDYFFWFWSVIQSIAKCLCSPSVCLLAGLGGSVCTHIHAHTHIETRPSQSPGAVCWEGEPHGALRRGAVLSEWMCICPFMYSVAYYVCILGLGVTSTAGEGIKKGNQKAGCKEDSSTSQKTFKNVSCPAWTVKTMWKT